MVYQKHSRLEHLSLSLSLFLFPQLVAAEKNAELCNFIRVEQGKKE